MLKEYLFDVQIVNYCPKHFYLIDSLNEKIGLLKAAGVINVWMERFIDKSYIKIKQEKTRAKIMNIQQLAGGFQILIIGILLSALIFSFEIFSANKHFKFVQKKFVVKRWNVDFENNSIAAELSSYKLF